MDFEEIELNSVITDIAAGPFGSNLKVSCFVDNGFPIIDGANLKGFKVTDNITKFVTEEKARSLHRSIAKRNDVIVTISGTLGQIAYIPEDSVYSEYLCSQRQFRVTFDTEKICVPYLVYYFHTYEGQHKILSFANQVGVPALSQPLKNFRQIKLFLPPLPTQKKIAEVLSSLDAQIELNRRINENLEQQAGAIFKEWFVDFGLFQNEEFIESEYGKIPKGWSYCKLEDLCEVITKGTTPTTLGKKFTETGINFIKGESILEDHSIDWSKVSYIDDETHNLLARSKIATDDIVFTIAGTLGRFMIIDNTMIPANTNQAVAIIRPQKEKIHPLVLYSYFIADWHNTFYTKNIQQSVQANLSLTTIKSLPILLPKNDILEKYEKLIIPIFSTIKQNQLENIKLAQIRDTLLPKLMSGELEM